MMFDDPNPNPNPNPRSFISPSLSAPSFPSPPPNPLRRPSPSPSPSPSRTSSLPSTSSSRQQPHHPSSASSSLFPHNARVALSLIPCSIFLLSLGGTPSFAALSAGLVLSYLLDSFRLPRASFFSLWLSLVSSHFALLFSPSFSFHSPLLTSLAFLFSSIPTFLLGVWASLQFHWLHLENPSVAAALERLLFACLPVAAPATFTWFAITAFGMPHAGYYHAALASAAYWAYALPRPPSAGSARQEAGRHLLGPLEGCIHTLHLLFVPLAVHIGSRHATLLSSLPSFCDAPLLFFGPLLFQLYASTHGALWWVTNDAGQLHGIQVVNGAIALVVVVLSLEVRVVFHAFGRYLHTPPPLNYLLVTVVMLGGACSTGAYAIGLVNDAVSTTAFTATIVFASGAAAIVVGFPILLIPVPLISGFYLARFFTKKSASSYFTFASLESLMVAWFVMHNYWDLNIWLAGMPLKYFCKLMVASVILALAIPGLVLLPAKLRFLTEFGLIGHALLLCYIEDRFFNYTVLYYFGFEEDVMYPSYMVVLTTFLGLALVRKLMVDHRIGQKAVWVLLCLYSSKLVILFITSKSALWVTAVLLLAISPPLLLYKDRSKTASKMKVWQGFTHAGVVAVSAWIFRETIFEALQWWNGRPPSDGLLLGSCILLTGLACIPIVALHFPHAQSAKRALVLVVTAGLLFVYMQPPVPLSWAYRSELIRAAHQSVDDISIYGFIGSKPSWPAWLLMATILLTLAAVTSIIPIKYIVELRALYAAGVGTTLGIYICVEYFFQTVVLYPFLVGTIICASIFVVFTHLPSASSPKILPWIFALMVALFPVTYLVDGQIRAKGIEEDEEAMEFTTALAIEGARMSLLGLYAMIFMVIALGIKFQLASLVREKALDRGINPNLQGHDSSFPPKFRLMQQRRASTAPSFTIKKLAAEAAWMPAVGNVATILCFIVCLILNMSFTGGAFFSIFFLAPILLLLNQDSDLLAGFGDRQRYFPVTVVISGYLVLMSLYRIWEEVWHGDAGWGMEVGGPGWFFAIKNVALLILTLPNHILFNRFMWDYVKQTDSVLLMTMPLNLPSIIMTDIASVSVLGILGVVGSLAQYLISRQIRIAGMRFI